MSSRKEKIPIVRFGAFSEPWFQNQLSEVAEFSKGRGYSKKDIQPQGTPIILYGRLYTKYESVISNIDTYANMEKNSVISEGGEVIIPASGESAAEISRASCVTDGGVILGGDINIVKLHENLDSSFIAITLSNGSQQRELSKRAQGKSVVHLHNSDLKAVKLFYPSYEEQTAIGSLFSTLDDLLSSYKDNLANYQSLKATMLSKMFPKAGQTVPEIRLDGFEGEWEKMKLKDVTESIEYGLNASAKEFDGENKYIRITDIDDVSRKFKENSLTSPDINVSECDNYLLCEKDILFARTGASVGKTYLYDMKDGKVYFAGFLIRARIKEIFDSKFIFQNTLTDRFTQYVKVTSQRSGQPGVNGKEYGEYELYLPKYEEQQAIGAYFSNLDNLIATHQEKISQLETLKKKLLQDMFI